MNEGVTFNADASTVHLVGSAQNGIYLSFKDYLTLYNLEMSGEAVYVVPDGITFPNGYYGAPTPLTDPAGEVENTGTLDVGGTINMDSGMMMVAIKTIYIRDDIVVNPGNASLMMYETWIKFMDFLPAVVHPQKVIFTGSREVPYDLTFGFSGRRFSRDVFF